ncbi:glyoxalase/bleomycin resistance protein/dioxygenase superfamily protein [Actinophytocola oryzae]|uniref:Glyoxalase/bleomycin resistance protein/dioxygenase superfamily protein n=1 Tax=Actinophytocola oryzae TaxID=502181 RepID=A0A4R7UTX5_9PSEU|nr:glyoxalase/bleomycin resistance protein/dioxygenase superfamily protein [Actinophytocola oryzae]
MDITVGVDTPDDIGAARTRLTALGFECAVTPGSLRAVEPVTGVLTVLRVEPRVVQHPPEPVPHNAPGRIDRPDRRAPGVLRADRVRPRRLGHVSLGTTGFETTLSFFRDGLGFRVSDLVGTRGAFLRCSTEHHNVLLLGAPVSFLHHTSWQVDDVNEVGRGASAMLRGHPDRHVWGLGRHHAGSNFFWYLRDPAGNFAEYYSDMDTVLDDQLWKPEVFTAARAVLSWGPPPPPSFLRPDDLGALMAGAHADA